MKKYSFEIIKPTSVDWDAIENAYDSTCFSTQAWFKYLMRCHLNPMIVKTFCNNEIYGYFVGTQLFGLVLPPPVR